MHNVIVLNIKNKIDNTVELHNGTFSNNNLLDFLNNIGNVPKYLKYSKGRMAA